MTLPKPGATRLENLVATMRLHGNEAENLDLEQLASFNTWTTAEKLHAEFILQQNGSRKLPEEVAATRVEQIPANQEDE